MVGPALCKALRFTTLAVGAMFSLGGYISSDISQQPGGHGAVASHSAKRTVGKRNPWGVRIGAIRWDGWYGHGDTARTGPFVEQSLGPSQYWSRLPFFASVGVHPTAVTIDGNHQEVMDREIHYAARMGIDFWAFMHYPPGFDGLDRALTLYLASASKRAVHFSLILNHWSYLYGLGRDSSGRSAEAALTDLVTLINDPGVELSFDDRPTVFVFNDICSPENVNVSCSPWLFDQLCTRSMAKFGTKPYFVFLGWASDPNRSSMMQAYLKLEGLSLYSANPADLNLPQNSPVTYSRFAGAIRLGLLDRFRNTGSQLVPFASAGWDPTPRFGCPSDCGQDDCCWQNGYGTNHSTVASGTDVAIRDHIRSVIEWTGYHRVPRPPLAYPAAPAQKILIYAWNEFDEGGWLCPTLAPDLHSPNLDRYHVLKALLRP